MKKININLLLNIIFILFLLGQKSSANSNLISKELDFQGDFKNWTLKIPPEQGGGIFSNSKDGLWYKTINFSLFAPSNPNLPIKYYNKVGKKFIFSKNTAKFYLVSSALDREGFSPENTVYKFDNQRFCIPHNDFKRSQTVLLSNEIHFIRGSKMEGFHWVYLPRAKSEESFFMDRFAFFPQGGFMIFKGNNVLIKVFNKIK